MARFVVAITGGVASGKSVVTRIFAAFGIAVADADEVAREIVRPGQPALLELVDCFGADILLADGSLDRARMRAIAFDCDESRMKLQAITHPRIRMELQQRCDSAAGPYAIVAIPLLAETGATKAYSWLSRILVVDAPVELQRLRLMTRDGIDEKLAERIIRSQAERRERLAIATDVIINDGLPSELPDSVARLHLHFSRMTLA